MRQKKPGQRGQQKKRQPKQASQGQADQQERRVMEHPLYGAVPLVPEVYTYPSGKQSPHVWWKPDPGFRPQLPPGAVAGDPSRQEFCSAHHMPKYFYLDEEKVCVQCGQSFIFTAHEQKFWYETLRFNFSSTAIRCRRCRRQRRSARALQQQLAEAVRLAEEQPDDPVAQLTLARATAEHALQLRAGNLERGIAAARRALKLAPPLAEALYWEGLCQELAGRTARARQLYAAFGAEVRASRRQRSLLEEAERRLAALPGAD